MPGTAILSWCGSPSPVTTPRPATKRASKKRSAWRATSSLIPRRARSIAASTSGTGPRWRPPPAEQAMEIRTLAEGLRFPEGPVACADGSVILVEIAAGALTRVAVDGTKTVVATPGGGPNGAAIGPDGKGYVVNNGGFEFLVDDQGRRRPPLQAKGYSGGGGGGAEV